MSLEPADREQILSHLRAARLLTGEPDIEPLSGGVSNDVFAIRVGGRDFVLKRALGKLKVAADWRSDIRRIHREAACQRWLCGVLEPGEVPAVVYEDLDRHVYLMERAPRESVNWKEAMLAGEAPPEAARRAGDLLGRIHAAGHGDEALRQEFGDQTVFDQLRLDPYLRTVARAHPDLATHLQSEIEALGTQQTLVHGDYSPKNILLTADRNILLDHEVAHYGDPRFDLAFFFTHLYLKALHMSRSDGVLWDQLSTAWAAYRERYDRVAEASWLRLWGAMLLARVDGKSPAEYLTPHEADQVRALGRRLVRDGADTITTVIGDRHSFS